MAVDTPAVIAILGAGPIGLETALYARYLGYDVLIYDRGEVAANVLQWGQVRMFTPFAMNRSPLGLAAVRIQNESYVPPGDEELLTGTQWRERYLLPLSQMDLLVDHLRLKREVIGVARTEILKTDLIGNVERADWMFRVLSRDEAGKEYDDEAEIVIDTTGVFSQPNWAGEGGLPALGEMAARQAGKLESGLPDIMDTQRERYAGKHTLVIGSGYSAATNLVALAKLAEEVPDTKLTWCVRQPLAAGTSPLARLPDDNLQARDQLAQQTQRLVEQQALRLISGSWVRSIELQSGSDAPCQIAFGGEYAGAEAFDRVLANVGYRPDRKLFEELQVHECYATGAPMKLAAELLKNPSADCLQIASSGPQSLLTTEPNFYILGSKSYGRSSNFLFAQGLNQIRDLFSIIGERATLDLYANAPQVSE